MKIKKFEATVLFVKDLKKSKKFYINKLGFTKTEESPGFVKLTVNRKNIALLDFKTMRELIGKKRISQENNSLISLQVENLDKTYMELKKKKVKFIKKSKLQSWGQYTAYFTDPDGHIWEIFTWKKKS